MNLSPSKMAEPSPESDGMSRITISALIQFRTSHLASLAALFIGLCNVAIVHCGLMFPNKLAKLYVHYTPIHLLCWFAQTKRFLHCSASHVLVLLTFTGPPLVCSQVQIVASHELCFLVACCSAHVCLAFCRGTKVSELRVVACMRWAPCVLAYGWEPGRLLSSGP